MNEQTPQNDETPTSAASELSAGLCVTEAERSLMAHGVFKGAHGLEGLLNADAFWERQPYGSRIYYGDGIADYLHRGVLRAAVEALTYNK